VLLEEAFVVVEVDCKEAQQFVEGTIDGHIPALELTDQQLDLPEESLIGLQEGEDLLGNEEDGGLELPLDVDVVLTGLGMED
jgi:hypothetical protein